MNVHVDIKIIIVMAYINMYSDRTLSQNNTPWWKI